jgi:C2 domain
MTTYGEETRTGTQGAYGTEGAYGAGVGGVPAGGFGRVILTIKSAHALRDKAWIGKADPYVEVKLADATISTHHVPNAGESATFDESFAFNNVAPDDVMEFHVYDKNKLRKDAHMGEGSITLRQVFESGRMETRVPLTTRTGTKDAGEVWISMRMEEGAGATGTTGAGYGTSEKMGYETGATTGATTGYETGTTGYETRTTGTATTERPAVCGAEYFTKVEDRPIVKERVTYVQEHRPVEKEYVVETRATGVEREAMEGRQTEHLGTEERVVAEAAPKSPCE